MVEKISWRRERLPTSVFCPGEFHGLYSPWGLKESDMTEWLSFQSPSHVQLFATTWTVAARLLCPWDFPGKNTGVGCHFLLQGNFLTQGSNLSLLHCWQILYLQSHQGSPCKHTTRINDLILITHEVHNIIISVLQSIISEAQRSQITVLRARWK